ncbi:response regulator [Myceligenerans indicum]|uniref:Response regulator transcription factor n=1 Tax=Myceligenerans indicum TaxID=2593663 RepID=A0ABS1LR99_9MICO|nr:response regulator transcription factor [Myceligenerans indicum]MBL0888683.1 response regulator transcription factor [Myceligenerans indicum]
MNPVRVLLADDQDLLRGALRTVLGADPLLDVVDEVGDGRAAIEAVRSHRIDVVLMDIRMPLLDGVRATEEITRLSPATKVLVLTTFDADELVVAAIRAGASGYLTKDTRPAALCRAVHDVAAGTSALAPGVAAKVVGLLRRSPRTDARALDVLTPREAEVFGLIVTGMSNAEIGARLYLTQNTVKTHVRALLMKLGLRDRVHVVIYAYEHGLVHRG